MSRRHAATRRVIAKDAKYKDQIVAKFINCLMWDGKKSIAEGIVYDVLKKLDTKRDAEPDASGGSRSGGLSLFFEALGKVRPSVEVKSKRVGGSTYQVPIEVSPVRSQILAIRWLIHSARKRGEKTMRERLEAEILDASQGRGAAFKKREDGQKMAEANRAFSHLRF